MHPKLVCSICLDDMFKDEAIVSLPCGHIFGESCIKEYMRASSTHKCPLCQTSYRSGKLQRIYISLEENANCYKEQCDELSEKTETLTKHCLMMARLSKMLVHNAAIAEEANAVLDEIVKGVNETLEIGDESAEASIEVTEVVSSLARQVANLSTEPKANKQATTVGPAASKVVRIPRTFRQLFKKTK
ncbi:hypothetical protein BD408DRAFT_446535 [Parasitella parasitica]|nr:hypothetical protein BD408DRAFT_446535 [Parasitella parasitica]